MLYEETKDEVAKLTITSPRKGIVLPPPYKTPRPGGEGHLPTWTGSPFEPKNVGARMERSDLICRVGNPKEMEAMLVIDQTDIELVHPGLPARLLTEAYVQKVLTEKIESIAQIDLKQSPAGLATQAGGDLNTKMDRSGVPRPISTTYQARVLLDNSDSSLFVGLRGQARIYPGWQSLGKRIMRYVLRTFHFHL